MLDSASVMTFIATTDAARARAFYEDILGLTFVADEEYALVFDLKGIMLRIQKVKLSSIPTRRSAGESMTLPRRFVA